MMQTVTTNEQIVALSVSRWGDLQRECGTKKGTRSLGGAQKWTALKKGYGRDAYATHLTHHHHDNTKPLPGVVYTKSLSALDLRS